MKFEYLHEYERDLKQLLKRFNSLNEDIEVLNKVLAVSPHASPPTSYLVTKTKSNIEIIKVKKFSCRALKGRGANSGIRVIYAFHGDEDKIVFIEIYFKSDKENEDRERIKRYCC